MTTLLRATKRLSLLGFFAFLFMVPMISVTHGQTVSSDKQTQTSCFDFYSFNSVKVHLENSRGVAAAGSGFPVHVTLNNENDYPIVGGSLYIKAYKKPTTTSAILGTDNGDLVDAFYGLTNLSIPAKGSISKDFTWKIPVGSVSGTYRLSPFFLVSNQFDVTGLSYSDDVHGAPLDLSVIGEATGSIYFDRQSVTVDGQRYLFSSLPVEVSSAGPVKVSVALVNDTDEVKTVPTSARIYRWSSNTTKNYISDMVHTVVVAPRSRTTIEFTLTEQVSVPFIELSAADGLSKTMMGIRFTRKGVSYPRLNFLGLKPSADGTSNQVFACFHGAGNNLYIANGGKVVVSATDSDGKVLGTKTYQGEVSGAMMALAFDAAVSQKTDKIIVRADSFQNGKAADSATVTYTCGLDIPCTVAGETETAVNSQMLFILLAAFVGVALITTMFFLMKKKKVNPVSLAIILALSVGVFAAAHTVSAECYVSASTGPVVNPKDGYFCSCTNISTSWSSATNSVTFSGTCTETALPTTDFCANIDGIQTSVPAGYDNTGGVGGQCNPHDACPNIDGVQQTVAPYVLSGGQCVIDSSANSAQKTVSWTGSTGTNNAGSATQRTLDALHNNRQSSDCTGASGACYLPWLAGMNLSLYYGAEVVDAQGNRVDESTKLKVGDKLTVRVLNRKNDQINWSLVGGVVGTPYGYWNSTYRGYSESDILADLSPYYKYYAPVIVSDPVVSVSQTGTANVTKVGPTTFVINSGGTIGFNVDFSATNASASISKVTLGGTGGSMSSPASSVSLTVPAQSIAFNYSVAEVSVENGFPSKPTISGPATLTAGSSGTYTINGTDPDGDQVYYDVSFLAASESGATRLPGSGLVNSGTNQTVNKSWLNSGTETVWARTVDSKGAASEWASYTVSVTSSFVLTTAVSGSGSITSNPAGINCGSTCAASFSGGTKVTLTATASGASSFTGWNGDCSGSGNTCVVTMDKARTTTATFTGTTCTDPSASNNGGRLPCIYTKTLSLSSDSCGAGTLSGNGTYNVGSSVSYSISNIPSNLVFGNWTNIADNSEVTKNTSGSITMNADVGLVAHCDSGPGEPPVVTDPDACPNIPGFESSVPANMVKAADGNCYCAEGNKCGPTECEPGTEAGSDGKCNPTFSLKCLPTETELQIIKGFSAVSKPAKVDVVTTRSQKLTFSAKLWSSIDGYITDSAVKYIWNGASASSITLPQSGTTSVFPQPEVSIKVTRALSETPDYRLVVGATNEYGIYHECPVPAVKLNKSVSGVTIKEH